MRYLKIESCRDCPEIMWVHDTATFYCDIAKCKHLRVKVQVFTHMDIPDDCPLPKLAESWIPEHPKAGKQCTHEYMSMNRCGKIACYDCGHIHLEGQDQADIDKDSIKQYQQEIKELKEEIRRLKDEM